MKNLRKFHGFCSDDEVHVVGVGDGVLQDGVDGDARELGRLAHGPHDAQAVRALDADVEARQVVVVQRRL